MQGPTGQNAEMDNVTLSTVLRIAFKFLISSGAPSEVLGG